MKPSRVITTRAVVHAPGDAAAHKGRLITAGPSSSRGPDVDQNQVAFLTAEVKKGKLKQSGLKKRMNKLFSNPTSESDGEF